MDNPLTPYQLSQIRDALGQSGSDQGGMFLGGLRLGTVDPMALTGEIAIDNSIKRSTAISAGAYRSTTQTIPDSTWTPVDFDTEMWDTDDMYNPAGYAACMYSRTGGIFIITAFCQWAANATGQRWARIILNNTLELTKSSALMSGFYAHAHSLSVLWTLNHNDYVELSVYQNSGGSLDIAIGASTYYPSLAMARIA